MKVLIAFLGWVLWTWGEFTIEKDGFDEAGKKFPIGEYAAKHWDNWVWNLIIATILIVVGQNFLHVVNITDDITAESLAKGDLYLLASGFIGQSLMFAYKKWIKKKKAEE